MNERNAHSHTDHNEKRFFPPPMNYDVESRIITNFLSTYEQTKVVKHENWCAMENWKTNRNLADQVRGGVHAIVCLVAGIILHRHKFEELHNENFICGLTAFYVTIISTQTNNDISIKLATIDRRSCFRDLLNLQTDNIGKWTSEHNGWCVDGKKQQQPLTRFRWYKSK